MRNRRHILCGAVTVLTYFAAFTVTDRAWATIKALDTASDPAYAADATNGAWQGQNSDVGYENPPGNDNGGFGFGPWDFFGGYSLDQVAPYNGLVHFIDGVDFPTTAYNNLGGPAFGLANAGIPYDSDFTVASRPFNQPLAVGDTFSMEIDTPTFDSSFGATFPSLYFNFNDSANQKTVGLWTAASFGVDYGWTYSDSTHHDAPVPGLASSTQTSSGSTLTFKLTTPTTAHLTIGGVGLDVTLAAGVPTSIYFAMFENNSVEDGSGFPTGEHAFYFDNLKIESSTLAGDYNGNGKVDAADYALWRKNPAGFGGATGYTTWRSNFGLSGGSGSGIGASSAVPEPTAAVLLIFGAISMAGARRNRAAILGGANE